MEDFGFIAFDSEKGPAEDFGFEAFEAPAPPIKRAKGIGESKRKDEDILRSQQAVKQLYKGLGLGALKTLAATSGADYQRRPQLTSAFEELLGAEPPTTPEQRITRRVAETAGGLPFLGIGAEAAPLIGASALGGGVEELTGSPLAGALAELTGGLGSVAFRGGPKYSKSFQPIAERAKKLGFTDKELTALSHGVKKRSFLSKYASKGEKAERLHQNIANAFDTAYSSVAEEAASLPRLNPKQEAELTSSLEKSLQGLRTTVKPSADKEAAIKYLDESLTELFQKGASPEELVNWYQDVNSTINWNAIRGGKKKLAEIKEPILKALESSSPELAQDFRTTNELYSRSRDLYKRLTPKQIEGFTDALQIPAASVGIFTGHPGVLYEVFGRVGAKRISYEFLTNPKLQGLSKKMVSAVKAGRVQHARKLAEEINNIIKPLAPREDLEEFEIES